MNLITAVNTLLTLLEGASKISLMIQRAQQENRDLSVDEMRSVQAAAESSLANLDQAIRTAENGQ